MTLPDTAEYWNDVKGPKVKPKGKKLKAIETEEDKRAAMPLLDFYPFPSTRPGTEEALDAIKKAFDGGKRFVLVNAPTGSGKSGISVAFARKHNTVILTPTKILQEQYATTDVFKQEYTIKGKANYKCGLPGLGHYGVDESICVSDSIAVDSKDLLPDWIKIGAKSKAATILKRQCGESGTCPYYSKLYNIGKVPGAILNYDLFFLIKQYPGQKFGTPMGRALVLDEAHQLIDKVRDIFGYKFSNVAAKRLLGDASGNRKKVSSNRVTRWETPIEWLERVLGIAQSRMASEKDSKKAARYDKFAKKVSYILGQELSDEKKFYIEDKEKDFEIKPLDLRYLKSKIFFPFDKILLLSATFPSNFREIFGIKEEESEIVTIPSSFKPKNRPIFFAKDLPRLNRNTVFKKKMPAIDVLDQILATHKDHKGIIHTSNYKFMDQLYDIYKRDKRFLWVDRDKDKNQMLEKHTKSDKPTILVSPSMMEGLDLKDELARFGVIIKVPYPMLDEYTKRMMRIFPTWYDNLTATNVCQAYGRQVRSAEDWSNFYILDGTFWNCIAKAKGCYSSYFLESLKVGSSQGLLSWLKTKEKEYGQM